MTDSDKPLASQESAGIELQIELGPLLRSLGDPETEQGKSFVAALKRGLDEISSASEIPGPPRIAMLSVSSDFFTLRLNGTPLRFSEEEFRDLSEYFYCHRLGELPFDFTLINWRTGRRLESGLPGDARDAEFASFLILETIKQHSRRLELERDGAARRPQEIDLVFHPQFLVATRDPMSELHQKARAALGTMSERLFYELGVRVPEIRFTVSSDLKPNAFALRWGGLMRRPRIGIEEGSLLVDSSPDRLELLGLSGISAHNPDNNMEASVIDEQDRGAAAEAGLSVCDPFEYILLACSSELRRRSAMLLDVELVEFELARLHQTFPVLAMTAARMISMKELTLVLQNLLDEEISIRNFRAILERLVKYDEIVSQPLRRIIFDDRFALDADAESVPPSRVDRYTEFVRSGLKQSLHRKYTRGQNTLFVHILAPKIEKLLLRPLKRKTADEILDAMKRRFEVYSGSAQHPVVLTVATLRPALRRLIAEEMPSTAALSFNELPPDLNIQILSRISLDSMEGGED